MSVTEDIHAIIENVMETRLNPGEGCGAYGRTIAPEIRIFNNNGVWGAEFRIDGRAFNLGKLLALSRRLGTEDIEIEVKIDTSYQRPDETDYSDPGPDDHVRYTIRRIRW